MNEPIIDSSGGVFVDLGYSPEEAAILQMRADLMAEIRRFIETRNLTQVKASEPCRVQCIAPVISKHRQECLCYV